MKSPSPSALICITSGNSIGGASIYVLRIALSMKEHLRLTPIVLCGKEGEFTALLSRHGIRFITVSDLVRRINPVRDVIALQQIFRYVSSIRPSLIILNSAKMGLVGRITCSLLRVPCVYVVHGWSFTGWRHKPSRIIGYILEALAGYLFSGKCGFIFVSRYDKDNSPVGLNLLCGKTAVIYNGSNAIDSRQRTIGEAARRQRLAEMFAHPEYFVFVTVCRLDEQKDVAPVLAALANVGRCNLIIVGGGCQQIRLKSMVQKLGIEDRVSFTGYVQPRTVPTYYRLADCFLLSSKWEGFPFAIVEAMHYSLPVLTSDVGGCCEIFRHGITVGSSWGSRNHPDLIAKKLTLYVDNPHLASVHGKGSLTVALKYYTTDAMLKSSFDFFRDFYADWSSLQSTPF